MRLVSTPLQTLQRHRFLVSVNGNCSYVHEETQLEEVNDESNPRAMVICETLRSSKRCSGKIRTMGQIYNVDTEDQGDPICEGESEENFVSQNDQWTLALTLANKEKVQRGNPKKHIKSIVQPILWAHKGLRKHPKVHFSHQIQNAS